MLLSFRIQLTAIVLAGCFILYCFFTGSPRPLMQWNTCEQDSSRPTTVLTDHYSFTNMNNDNSQAEKNNNESGHVLILTPFKQSVQFIDRFFDNVNKLTYPHHLISLGFLVSDSTDGTIEKLKERAEQESKVKDWRKFHNIAIFQKDFKFEMASNEDRHAFEVQVKRRVVMAKSRNTLLSAALTERHEWVLWLDGDVTDYPETLLQELISLDKDVLVPNCFWHSYNEEGGYDKNNWQETKESWELQESMPEEQVLVEGYPELVTHRKLMIDMRHENDNTDLFHAVPLDGVGGTCTLVRARVHRDGAVFPPFPFRHQVETEGLAKIAKSLGYEVWGLPNYLVYHHI